ncbi:PHP domain-containing protein [Thermoanaerobacter thermocopriae]|uniref:PHP domain-containing protein n=1 Tax=Thermoanaerobacter thermocopriae TaxID=29350 RepID=UPI00048B845C|nr:PHP domain-containing protein [Thermoanaerobacter thermocopriae]
MMLYYDLHIHTALSPCASDDMTPNNIVNMASIKGLDVIAITDHNSAKNVKAVYNLGLKKGLIVVPGIEVQTREEVHILCYFYSVDECIKFSEIINKNLIKIKNKKTIFGNQFVMDEEDNIAEEIDYSLLVSSNLSVNEIFDYMEGRGVAVPAHVDRHSYSIISNLGFIPNIKNLITIEVSKAIRKENFLHSYPEHKKYKIIRSSDAHYLGDISEKEEFLLCGSELKSIVDWLRGY